MAKTIKIDIVFSDDIRVSGLGRDSSMTIQEVLDEFWGTKRINANQQDYYVTLHGKTIQKNDTLLQAGVNNGDTLLIISKDQPVPVPQPVTQNIEKPSIQPKEEPVSEPILPAPAPIPPQPIPQTTPSDETDVKGINWNGVVLISLIIIVIFGVVYVLQLLQNQGHYPSANGTGPQVQAVIPTSVVYNNQENNANIPDTPLPVSTPQPIIYHPFPNNPECAPSRLRVGDRAYVVPEATRLNVRCYADTHPGDNILYKKYPYEEVEIIGGPECNYGWILWRVQCDQSIQWRKASCYDPITCWIAETDNGEEFWLVPIN